MRLKGLLGLISMRDEGLTARSERAGGVVCEGLSSSGSVTRHAPSCETTAGDWLSRSAYPIHQH